MEATLFARATARDDQGAWLYNRSWDLTYVILSAALVFLPLTLYYHILPLVPPSLLAPTDRSRLIDLLVAVAIGGPHMYSTFSVTFMERRFLQRHPWYAASALLIPVAVVYAAVVNLKLLLTFFLFWASIHVLHQIVFLVECYRYKGRSSLSLWSRAIDYAVVFSSLYPIAMYKLVNDLFIFEQKTLQIPEFVKTPLLFYAVSTIFAVSLLLFIGKTIREARAGLLNWPKTLLILVTVTVAFIIPAFDPLEVAFQGMNVWHSLQYLALIWYMNKLRKEYGEISNPLVAAISGSESGPRFYFFHVAITLMAGVAILVLAQVPGLTFEQSYYIVILSCLLIHYYFDHFLFTRVQAVVRPA